MRARTRLPPGEGRLLPLLGLLVVATVAHFSVNPGGIVTDGLEVSVPLLVLAGLLVLFVRSLRGGRGDDYTAEIGRLAWLGALSAAVFAAALGTYFTYHRLPVVGITDEMLTVVSVGVGAGMTLAVHPRRLTMPASSEVGEPRDARSRHPVLAESTWTSQPDPDGVLVEVVERIAELEGVDPVEIEPLSSYVDPEVFERLTQETETSWQLAFHAWGYEIRVSSHGTVTVYDGPPPAGPREREFGRE